MRKFSVVTGCIGLALVTANATEVAPNVTVPLDAGACAPGFVHRLSRPTDHVCVTPQAHARTVRENKDAPSRTDPKGAYGANSCKSGYVWREALEGDAVCVTPAVRSIVLQENLHGFLRARSSRSTGMSKEKSDDVPTGPWLCGEETTDIIAKSRSGHVVDVQGRVWAYGLVRKAVPPPFVWQKDEKSEVVTWEELNKRYAGAIRAGRDIAVAEVAPHLVLIEKAAESEFIWTDQLHLLRKGETTLYCLSEDKVKGSYREIVLEQRGVGVQLNRSAAARELIAWFQPSFRIVD